MTIVELLNSPEGNCARLAIGDRWLCGDDKGGFHVYQRGYRRKITRCIIQTEIEFEAVQALLYG